MIIDVPLCRSETAIQAQHGIVCERLHEHGYAVRRRHPARLSPRLLEVEGMQHPEAAHELERARIQLELLGVHDCELDALGHAASLGLGARVLDRDGRDVDSRHRHAPGRRVERRIGTISAADLEHACARWCRVDDPLEIGVAGAVDDIEPIGRPRAVLIGEAGVMERPLAGDAIVHPPVPSNGEGCFASGAAWSGAVAGEPYERTMAAQGTPCCPTPPSKPKPWPACMTANAAGMRNASASPSLR